MLDYGQILQAGQSLVPNLRDQLLQDKQFGMQQKLQEQALAKARLDMDIALNNAQREEDFHREAVEVFANPTRENIAVLQGRYPQHIKAIQSVWDTRQEAQRTEELTYLGSLFTLLRGGKVAEAARKARARYEVDREAGLADEVDLAIVELLESGDPEAASKVGGMLTIMISSAVGPDKMGATYQDLGEESRAQELHPSRIGKAESEASIAAAEATAAPSYYTARAARESADADIAASDARYADRKNASEIAGRNARTEATRGREARAGSSQPTSGKPRRRPKYIRYARDAEGNRVGFNAKTKKWEKVN